jgi:hypothetical protein
MRCLVRCMHQAAGTQLLPVAVALEGLGRGLRAHGAPVRAALRRGPACGGAHPRMAVWFMQCGHEHDTVPFGAGCMVRAQVHSPHRFQRPFPHRKPRRNKPLSRSQVAFGRTPSAAEASLRLGQVPPAPKKSGERVDAGAPGSRGLEFQQGAPKTHGDARRGVAPPRVAATCGKTRGASIRARQHRDAARLGGRAKLQSRRGGGATRFCTKKLGRSERPGRNKQPTNGAATQAALSALDALTVTRATCVWWW